MAQCDYSDTDARGETVVCISNEGHRGRHALRDPRSSDAIATKEYWATPAPEVVTVGNTEGGEVTAPITEEDAAWMNAPLGPKPADWTPQGDDFISLKGKAYLPARRRIQWMRGLPIPRPDWTIDTEIVEHERGILVKPGSVGVGKVDKGFAVVRANIYDETGRLIATGLKSEYSENFTDYLEKAETGAIARALAVAGYGTESALDLDEGVDAGRIADSPVEVPTRRPTLSASTVPGVGRGGRTDGASVAQIRAVAALSREQELGAQGLAGVMGTIFKDPIPRLPADEAAASITIADFLSKQASADVGRLIAALEAAGGDGDK